MSRFDRILAWTAQWQGTKYYANGGDSNRNGIPDRADLFDGNGVDCSGWVYSCFSHAWAPSAAPFPLSSSAGYALLGVHASWVVPLRSAQPGDILIYDKYGDPYASDGPRGHTGILVEKSLTEWRTSESAGSNGVGFYKRSPSFWIMAIRVPGTAEVTPEQFAALLSALEQLDVEHGMAVDCVLNPNDPTSGYTLDRWGGIHWFGKAVPVTGTGYWPGQDVARRLMITDWARGRGYVMDLDGGLHPVNGAPEITSPGLQGVL